MTDANAEGQPEKTVSILFRKPVRPGTPEAQAEGCLCRFEINMNAAFYAADHGYEDTILVISKECPVHEIIDKPMDDVIGGG